MYCSKCGAENQDGARFCNACGQALSGAGPAAPPVQGPASSRATAGALIGLLVVVAIGVGYFIIRTLPQSAPPAATPVPPVASPAPVPATDNVAAAQVVLEQYLAADLGHDGDEMKKYLGGQAAARFEPSVQGQEDLTVHSQQVSGHTVKDDNTIRFAVEVKWAAEGSSAEQTQTDSYTLKRTDQGWKITSTPAYPE